MDNKKQVQQIIEKEEEGPTLDYKEDYNLKTDGDKAKFIKDVLGLANSGQKAHIILGIEDGTRKLKGIESRYKAEQFNDILKGKCDPPLTIEYAEKTIMGYKVGVIEFNGENPPYIVSVNDKYGGPLSASSKRYFIERGTVFIRPYNKNEGASRAELDKIYKVKYVTLQPDLRIAHEVSVKSVDDLIEADIEYILLNISDVLAGSTYVWIQFKNIKQIVRCTGRWIDVSKYNDNIPTIQLSATVPVCPKINLHCKGAIVRVEKEVNQIEASVKMGATNTRIKEGTYVISLEKHQT